MHCSRPSKTYLPPILRPTSLAALTLAALLASTAAADESIDFNRQIRPILSNNCFQCHGPDEAERQGGIEGLRLDTAQGALADIGGYSAVVPGKPDESPFVERITSTDPDLAMPPAETGKKLTPQQIELLTKWVRQGAPYAQHWSYEVPTRPELPRIDDEPLRSWPINPIDHFILARLKKEQLAPSSAADRYALIRRVTLDLTGLPPTLDEVEAFLSDNDPKAYERLVDRLLNKKAFGEHWARMWLDVARYADSAGYADDPQRTIWAYRDYVIRSLNQNKPFDQFTLEQIAGDLLPRPEDEQRANEQLVATAFHRNTLTNSEGGTNDEEFRNAAIVDRVNTTMEVFMGTTMACAQCHTHKYDPLSQEEYFQLFAIFNNTADADRRDESPLLTLWSDEQQQKKTEWTDRITELETKLATTTPDLQAAQDAWEARLQQPFEWTLLSPQSVERQSEAPAELDGPTVRVTEPAETDVYTVRYAVPQLEALSALELRVLSDERLPNRGPGLAGGNFVLSRISATIIPPEGTRPTAQFVRVELPGKQKMISLAEVQVFGGAPNKNLALAGAATQSSTDFGGPPELAIDGNTNGDYHAAKSTTHTAVSDNPWWELDLKGSHPIDSLVIWNRTDGNLQSRLNGAKISLLDDQRNTVWTHVMEQAPQTSESLAVSGSVPLNLISAFADVEQTGFEAAHVLSDPSNPDKGWAVAPEFGKSHSLTLLPDRQAELPADGTLELRLEQTSKHPQHLIGSFQLALTADERAKQFAALPAPIKAIVRKPTSERSEPEASQLATHFRAITPLLKAERDELAQVKKQLAEMKPNTTVPIMQELEEGKRRVTRLQHRGNYLDTGQEVQEGTPAVFHPLRSDLPPNRLALAHWLVDPQNPLTARVTVNRFWEKLFGRGLVRTSEDFGSQGDLPSHSELLDWLAVEFQEDWDVKEIIRLMVTSATYRQSSKVTPELLAVDPENELLARGPRFRLSAEMIRDQALFVSGLLSSKMYGPSVQPPRPNLGLRAAFGSSTDWTTSKGEDRYRRGLYTEWRRSMPYPSMATFDAPNREVCTTRRVRTNTPLQALVTMNDPVYVEAAQALARRVHGHEGSLLERAAHGFQLCLVRPPNEAELKQLVQLFQDVHSVYQEQPEEAMAMATDPLGPLPKGADAAELAAWTVVANVLLNLDEVILKR